LFDKWLNTGFWPPESKFYYTDIKDITREMPIAFTLGNTLNLLTRNGQDSRNIQVFVLFSSGSIFKRYTRCSIVRKKTKLKMLKTASQYATVCMYKSADCPFT